MKSYNTEKQQNSSDEYWEPLSVTSISGIPWWENCLQSYYDTGLSTVVEKSLKIPQSMKNNWLLECKLLLCIQTDQNPVFAMVRLVTQQESIVQFVLKSSYNKYYNSEWNS